MALKIADRLTNVEDVIRLSDTIYDSPWRGGLGGAAGIALFYAGVLQVSDESRYREALHRYMKLAVRSAEHLSVGLYTGLCGLIAACECATVVEPRYSSLLGKCVDALSRFPIPGDRDRRPAGSMDDYDVISGAAGIALSAAGLSKSHGDQACDLIAWYLSDEARWRCPRPARFDRGPLNDLGLAHGAAGMIAALAIAGLGERRYDRAMRSGLAFLLAHQGNAAIQWPASVGIHGSDSGRTGWCYGAPGGAAAVFSCAQVLNDGALQQVALEIMRDLTSTPEREWSVPDNAICHGHAGNALIFTVLGRLAGDQQLTDFGSGLSERLVAAYDEALPFGYQAWTERGFVDAAGLLGGAAGIGLTLLTIEGKCDSSWLRYLGIPNPAARDAEGSP